MNRICAAKLAALWALTIALAAAQPNVSPPTPSPHPPKVNFVDVAPSAGLIAKTEDGGDKTKRYIIETTGSGVAAFDFDNDGWPDIFLAQRQPPRRLPQGT